MKNFKYMHVIPSALFGLGLVAVPLFAHPANPNVASTVKNADGSEVTVRNHGDEHYHYATTEDGYLVVPDSNGNYVYADEEGNATSFKAKNATRRSSSEKKFLKGLDKEQAFKAHKEKNEDRFPETRRNEGEFTHTPSYGVDFDADASLAPAVRKRPTNKSESWVSGECWIPVMLVATSDKAGGDSTLFYRFLNEQGFTDEGNYGSLRDYYMYTSNNKFQPHFDIYPITLPNAFSTYTEATFTSNAIDILVQRADFQANSSKYERKSPFIYLYPGMETDALEYDEGYWGHQYWMQYNGSGTYGKAYCSNNYCFDKYLFIAQKEDGTNDGKLNQLGIFAHEFSHVMGLADHYGYDSSNNFISGPTPYDVMTQGMYNDNGRRPPMYSAFEQETMNWLTLTEASESQTYSIHKLAELQAVSVTNPSHNDEYYVVEYRPNLAWDAKIGENGIFLWYIDYSESAFYDENNPNGDTSHQRVTVKKVVSAGENYTDFSYTNNGGTAKVPGVYSFVFDGTSRACFTTNSSMSLSACPAEESSSSSEAVVASSSSETVVASSSSEAVAVSSATVEPASSSSRFDFRSSSSIWPASSESSIAIAENASIQAFEMQMNAGVLSMTLPSAGTKSIGFFDMQGHQVKGISITGNSASISLQGTLPQGAYIVRVTSGKKVLGIKKIDVQ